MSTIQSCTLTTMCEHCIHISHGECEIYSSPALEWQKHTGCTRYAKAVRPAALPTRPIIIDTREQRPYEIDGAIRAKLDAGDYSLLGMETRLAIERKSLDDWIGTILRDRKRFNRELAKLQTYDYACIVIEATEDEVMQGQYKSQIAGPTLLALTTHLSYCYSPVDIVLAGDRPHARVFCLGWLARYEAEIERADQREKAHS